MFDHNILNKCNNTSMNWKVQPETQQSGTIRTHKRI